jgi:hypothetical protein
LRGSCERNFFEQGIRSGPVLLLGQKEGGQGRLHGDRANTRILLHRALQDCDGTYSVRDWRASLPNMEDGEQARPVNTHITRNLHPRLASFNRNLFRQEAAGARVLGKDG